MAGLRDRLGDELNLTRRRWLELSGVASIGPAFLQSSAFAQTPAAPGPVTTVDQLLGLNLPQIESVYRQGTAAGLPAGRIRGTALVSPGTSRNRIMSRGARLVWQGKIINPTDAVAVNRFFGIQIIRAQVYQGASWLDGGASLILDYSHTSRIYASNRDEIRLIAPGLYLGLMYARATPQPTLSLVFALEAQA